MRAIKIIVLVTAALAGFSACAPRMAMLHPAERYLVTRGAESEPLPLIGNDSAAGDAFLRTSSARVDPGDPALRHLISRMQASVEKEKGVGIAAPQVGVSKRVILVQRIDLQPDRPFRYYLNPEIASFSKEQVVDWEGCLSVPAGFGQVSRSKSVLVRHQLLDGRVIEEEFADFVARIFQHEIDHLNGVLFIDRRQPGELLPPDEYRKMRAEREKGTAPPPTGPGPAP
jgi:peptide deformylase